MGILGDGPSAERRDQNQEFMARSPRGPIGNHAAHETMNATAEGAESLDSLRHLWHIERLWQRGPGWSKAPADLLVGGHSNPFLRGDDRHTLPGLRGRRPGRPFSCSTLRQR